MARLQAAGFAANFLDVLRRWCRSIRRRCARRPSGSGARIAPCTRASRDKYCGLRQSREGPALGIALRGFLVKASIFSIASSMTLGPEEQFRPITSTGHSSRRRVKSSVEVPSRRRPSSSMLTCAMIAMSSPATSRAAKIASRISFESRKVSRISRSTPASISASICSRKMARASSKLVGPRGSSRMPRGPTVPATKA